MLRGQRGETEVNCRNSQSRYPVSRLKFERDTSVIKVKNIAATLCSVHVNSLQVDKIYALVSLVTSLPLLFERHESGSPN
jgi:hypothetical protein